MRKHSIPPTGNNRPQTGMPRSAKACHGTNDSKTEKTPTRVTVLRIDEDYRLAADRYCWKVERRKRRKHRRTGQPIEDWETLSYHPNLEGAVNSLAEYCLRVSGVQSVEQALAEVARVSAALTTALRPRYTVREVA